MKLVNPKWANQKVNSSAGVLECDADGVLDCPEEMVQAMLNSGFKKVDADAKSAKKPAKAVKKAELKPKEEKAEAKAEDSPAKAEEKPKKKRSRWRRSED